MSGSQKITLNINTKPKGRLLNERAVHEVKPFIDAFLHDKSLLIEAFHAIQDHFGHLSYDHLHAVAHLFSLSKAEVYEVASFYHHFHINDKKQKTPTRVCISLTCHHAGALSLAKSLTLTGHHVIESPCLGLCDQAPAFFEGHFIAEKVDAIKIETPHFNDLKAGKITSNEIIKKLETANLRGLGGAGFKTALKWSIVRAQKGEKLMVVNADEGEPGTFKDKYILENHVSQFLDGLLVAAFVVEAKRIYIYLRDEYPKAREILKAAIASFPQIELRRGAGAYICGEESALIESLEGKRGLPRLRPPFVGEKGLFGQPTLVNNVETLYFVSEILHEKDKGERHYSVSGAVRNPGVYRVKGGITARELLEKAGGMKEGHQFKAYLPGGASGGILPENLADLSLDFGTLAQYGAFVGSHAVIFISDQHDLKQSAKNLLKFFEHESCGQCTPCREGTGEMGKLLDNPRENASTIERLGRLMMETSICGLGQAAPNPALSLLKHFKGELS